MSLVAIRQNIFIKTRVVIVWFSILALSEFLGAEAIISDETHAAQDPSSSPPLDYESWEIANGITGAGATADSDGDGIPNGIEFVIGGDPSGPASDSNNLLPAVTVDNDFMYFISRRSDDAAGDNPSVEYSSSLTQWTQAEPGVNGVFIEETMDFYEPGVARLIVRIPRTLATGTGLFARLRVVITP